MGEAGLTIGGFYAHFESKSDLFRACFEKASEVGFQRVMAGAGQGEFLKPVQRYLSEPHVQSKAEGCPLAALISELDQIQADGPLPMVDAYLNRLSGELVRLGADDERVFALYAMMLGALTLARAVSDSALKERILTQSLRTAKAFSAGESQEKI
jgi:TetR/AcrR family transcriptional repressor of nem operon